MNELARNSVGEMASCLAGITEQDLAMGASAGEVDVQLLVKVSFGYSSMMAGFMPTHVSCLPVIFLKMTNYPLLSLPRFHFVILWSML